MPAQSKTGILRTGATEPWQMDATELSYLIRCGKLSSREATLSCLSRLDEVNPAINAVTLILREQALAQADDADARLVKGEILGQLHGVPVTTKCNTDQLGCPSDDGVVAFRDRVAQSDNPVVANMRAAGAVFIGRTNTPAFSMRFETDNELHGRTLNPYSKAHTAGGSSGGAAAAVAVGICSIAQGNDLGGSVRWPAYCNGVVGLRTSYGRIPSFNETTPGGSLISAQLMAVHGPITRTIRDARMALSVMSRRDQRDHRWVDVPLRGPTAPKKVALVPEVPGTLKNPAVAEVVREAGRRLAAAGYIVEEKLPPQWDEIYEIHHRILVVDLVGGLKDSIAEFGDASVKRAMAHWQSYRPAVSFPEFLRAWKDRDAAMATWATFLADTPIVITPISAGPAFSAGLDAKDEASMATVLDTVARCLYPVPTLGLPALSVPLGSQEGLPLGVQIIAGQYREDLCLDAGEIIEAYEGLRSPIDPVFN
ncbi:amidase [Mesorhizobium sp. M2A.F.Ca.ET.067.02.1.1]|nr:amidase [Mesorhizobium sp. M2A.F.Ca.ET.067.02.1.1]TIU58027.1 MAG: amidase [Mesorhizobium sp.]